jgi:ABC-2 type transport system permease protein
MVFVFALVPVLMMFIVFGTLFESVKELPGFPTENYYEYLAPAAVLMTTVPGISNSAVALATDFHNRFLYKLLTTPASLGSIMLGRLLGDGLRLYIQAGGMLLLTMAFGARVATGLPGALLMVLIGVLFAVVTFGVLTANIALKTKNPASVQAVYPMAWLLIFLTTAFQTNAQIESGVLRTITDINPTEYVLRAMRDLMINGYDWVGIGLAFLIILGLGLLGLPLTIRNYRAVYK